MHFKTGQKEVLQHNEQEIEELQESISSISVQLLDSKYLYKFFIAHQLI